MHKKLFLASVGALALTGSAALAAEPLPPPPPPPLIFTWTGPYVGGQVGYGWGSSTFDLSGVNPGTRTTALFVISDHRSPSGVVGGAHVGYLYQINQFVVGVEGSVDGTSLTARAHIFVPAFIGNDVLTARASLDVQGSIRGKLGVAWDRVLIYGTGGVAFGGFSSNLFLDRLTPTGIPFPIANRFFSNTRTGWTAGGGIQYAVTDNWWIFAEYRYTNFGGFNNPLTNLFAPGGPLLGTAFVSNNIHLRENQVQAGFSYRFNLLPPPPLVAKY
jgi:outer membrane immunogenic protein